MINKKVNTKFILLFSKKLNMYLEQDVCQDLPFTLEAITISLNTRKHSNLLMMNQDLLHKLLIIL